MSVFHENMLIGASGQVAAGGISRSIRLNAPDSAYLSRTPASAGNRRTWTWAGWVKRGALGSYQTLFHAYSATNNTNFFDFRFDNADKLTVGLWTQAAIETTQVFRDASAWYHIVLAVDTNNGTAANRVRLYVNGSEVTTFSQDNRGSYSSVDFAVNATIAHNLGGRNAFNNDYYFSGYLADCYLIDGQQLTPSSFTETDATTGQLIPKAFSGSYGSQGWHLEFADNSSNTATTLGKDTSGLGNNWTPNNLSVTAGAGNDSLVDVPTNGAQTDTGVGGEVRGNYATLNPLKTVSYTLSNGNLDFAQPASASGAVGTVAIPFAGKWYWEITPTHSTGEYFYGVIGEPSTSANLTTASQPSNFVMAGYAGGDGRTYKNSFTAIQSGLPYRATGYVWGIAIDVDANTIQFYVNGATYGSAISTALTSGVVYLPWISSGNNSGATHTGSVNFGQRPFAYTAPSGFKALCTANLPAPVVTKPNTVFDVALWTGNSGTQSITGLGFSPDFVWGKTRSAATYYHALYDTVRGAGPSKSLYSNATDAEGAQSIYTNLTSFDSAGFTLGSTSPNNNILNQSGQTFVGWCWDAGSSTVTNTQGSITSSVRANATAGFSIVTYTGNGNSASTVGHGLGVAPPLVIAKSRSTSDSWVVYTNIIDGSNDYLLLNSTAAKVNSSHSSPTSTVFNPSLTMGPSVTCVAYCFAPVVGYSSFGSYVGNGSSDGPMVYTGFRPRFLLVKNATTGGSGYNWEIYDSARNTYNVMSLTLLPNTADAEINAGSGVRIDFLSNGFKWRDSGASINGSGNTMIYAAFAESPFNYARAR